MSPEPQTPFSPHTILVHSILHLLEPRCEDDASLFLEEDVTLWAHQASIIQKHLVVSMAPAFPYRTITYLTTYMFTSPAFNTTQHILDQLFTRSCSRRWMFFSPWAPSALSGTKEAGSTWQPLSLPSSCNLTMWLTESSPPTLGTQVWLPRTGAGWWHSGSKLPRSAEFLETSPSTPSSVLWRAPQFIIWKRHRDNCPGA